MSNKIKIFPNLEVLFFFAAQDFKQRAVQAVKDKGSFSVVLSGGSTPKLFFDVLAQNDLFKNEIPWADIHFFFGDERYVAPTSEDSNYHMACTHLFSKVAVTPAHIHRVMTEAYNPVEAAQHYERTLRALMHVEEDHFPAFDLIYLGLGDDAHTASLMPYSDVVEHALTNTLPASELVSALFVKKLNQYRISFTPNAINNCQNIIFLVTGQNKAKALHQVLENTTDPLQFPAQLIHGVFNDTLWFIDQAAASLLSPPPV